MLVEILVEDPFASRPIDRREVPGGEGNHEQSDDDETDGEDPEQNAKDVWWMDFE